MCVLHMSSSPSYIVKLGRFGACIFGNHREPSLHGGMQSPVKSEAEQRWWGCARTLVGLPRDHLHLVGSWMGLDPVHGGILPRYVV